MNRTVRVSTVADPKQALMLMAEGNPGAINVLMKVIERFPLTFQSIFEKLDAMNIRGPQIWEAWKRGASCNVEEMVRLIEADDPGIVETINRGCAYEGELARIAR